MEKLKSLYLENKAFFITISVLTILVILSVLFNSFFSFNSVSEVKHLGSSTSASLLNQSFLITFERPMKNEAVESLISFDPKVDFKAQWSGRSLILRVNQSLKPATEYKLTLDKKIKDLYDGTLQNNYEYKFKTESIYLYYLEESSLGSKVIKRDILTGSEEELYSSESILDFYVKDRYLVIIYGQANHRKAKLLDLHTKIQKEIFDQEKHLVDIKFHPVSNEIWALQQEIFIQGEVVVPIGNKEINRYIIDQDKVRTVLFNSEIQSVESFFISPGGDELLIQESFSNRYSIINIEDPQIWSPLGKYAAGKGFDLLGENLLFVVLNWANLQDPSWVVIRNNKGESILSDKDIEALDPFFVENQVAFSSAYDKLTNDRSIFDIKLSDQDGIEISTIHADGYSLEYGRSSLDGGYIILNGYSLDSLQDPFTFIERLNSIPAPAKFTLFIYDVSKGSLTNTGIETTSAKFY